MASTSILAIRIVSDASKAMRDLDKVSVKVGSLSGVASKSAKVAGAALGGMAIGSVIKDSVNLEAAFSRTMATLAASTGAPQREVAKLHGLALKLGADTQFSANEAADAMLELAKAGIPVRDIMTGAAKGTLLLATAGGTDLATAATIASNAMNTFNLTGKDMGKIAAALAGGANASSASVESLGLALSQVGPGAKNAGLSLQETVAALSAFDAAGVKGSDAGTSLKTFLARLVPQTEKASKAFEELGLWSEKTGNKLVDQQGNFKSLTQISGLLQKGLKGMSDAERTAALNAAFGSDASRAAIVLGDEGAAGLRKYIKATKDQNAAQKMADAAMSGTAGAMERLKGSVENAKLALGEGLAPVVQSSANFLSEKLVPAVTKVASVMSQHEQATRNVAAALGIMVAAVLVTLTVLKIYRAYTAASAAITAVWNGSILVLRLRLLAMAAAERIANAARVAYNAVTLTSIAAGKAWLVGKAAELVAWVRGAAATVAATAATLGHNAVMFAAAAASKAWAAAQWLVNIALTANPIGLIVVAIAALVAAIVIAWKKSDTFRRIVTGAFSAVQRAASAAFGWVKRNWPLLLAILTGPIGLAVLLITKNWDKIKAGATAAKTWVVGKFDALVRFVRGLPSRIGSATAGMFDGIKSAFRSAINYVIDKWNGLSFSLPAVDTHIKGIGKIGGFSLSTPNIPRLHAGGIVTSPTLLMAGDNKAGGSGAEAIIPLDRLGGPVDLSDSTIAKLAAAMLAGARATAAGAVTSEARRIAVGVI